MDAMKQIGQYAHARARSALRNQSTVNMKWSDTRLGRIVIPALFFLLSYGLINNALAQEKADPTVQDMVYLVVYRPGSAWIEGKSIAEQQLLEHGRFWLAHYAEGRMLKAGPFTDDSGGAVIFRADDLSAGEALIAKDPAVVAGVLVGTVHPWLLRNWAYYLERKPAP